MRRPGKRTLSRDGLSYVLGWGLILHQAGVIPASVLPASEFNLIVFLGGLGMIGVSTLMADLKGGLPARAGADLADTTPPEPDSVPVVSRGSSVGLRGPCSPPRRRPAAG